MKKFRLINNDQEKSKFQHINSIQRDDIGNEWYELYKDNSYFIMYAVNKRRSGDIEEQIEIPLVAISWIKDTIVNGFWRKPSEGGLAKNQHAVTKLIGEELLISRSMNAGTYGKAGFNIRNKSRSSYILDFEPQSVQITDELLQSSLLQIFDDLIN